MVGPGQTTARPTDECARKAVAALAGREKRILIAGERERFGVLLSRLSPNLLARVIRNAKVT